jgi:hypothetical protein
MDGDGGEIKFAEETVKFACSADRLNKDDDLVELESVRTQIWLDRGCPLRRWLAGGRLVRLRKGV